MAAIPSNQIDLRSDTVTQPCRGMREAMARADVGDDVNGDDPTVIRLQEEVAGLLGMEASLFVPSGTMSNAVAIRAHTQPGDEIITEESSHIYVYEGGGYAAMSGCSISLVKGKDGIMAPDDIINKIRKSSESRSHYPNTSLISLENTSNMGGGTCYPIEVINEISRVAKSKDCKIHMDGARIFNAACFTGQTVRQLVHGVDSVTVCLSKGLGAPVGSILAGSKKFIQKAHRWRKMFGGGMRQSGVLAAAGIYALENNLERLERDHLNAQALAEGLNGVDGLFVDFQKIQTNIVYVETNGCAKMWVENLAKAGVHCFVINEKLLRMVTHLQIDKKDIETTLEIATKIQ
jgi:threonine aldolase